MIIAGAVLSVLGIILTIWGFCLNNSLAARFKAYLLTGNGNPGTVLIVIGIIVLVSGIVLLIIGKTKKSPSELIKGATTLNWRGRTCPYCVRKLDRSGVFCPFCGKSTAAKANVCPACGSALPAGSAFCPKCGNQADGSTRGSVTSGDGWRAPTGFDR